MKVELKILNKKIIKKLPDYATIGSAGIDLRASISQCIFLKPKQCILVATGIAIYINNKNYAGIILPRSGLGHKIGLVLGNGVGLIDSDYQGEVMVSCFNRTKNIIKINPLMKFAQLIIIPIIKINFNIVQEFSKKTIRSTGSFGHTGI